LQRSQRYVNVIGPEPVHVPALACRTCPWTYAPDAVGGEVFTGLAAVCGTTAVGFDAVVPEPALFEAVTRTRSRWPASRLVTTYVDPVAPEMTGQFEPSGAPPLASQRTHWKLKLIGVAPDHEPLEAVSVEPTLALPEMVGSAVLSGADAETTTAVGVESAEAEPCELLAVTRSLILLPTSPASSAYAGLAAPDTAVHRLGLTASQRSHWNAKETGGVPDQTPVVPVRVCPCRAVPETVGRLVFDGAALPAAVETPPARSAMRSTTVAASDARRRGRGRSWRGIMTFLLARFVASSGDGDDREARERRALQKRLRTFCRPLTQRP